MNVTEWDAAAIEARRDAIKLLAGYEYYQGGSDTLFGYLKKNNVLFAELRYFY